MKCISCGQEIKDGSKFCPKCGASQKIETPKPIVAESVNEEINTQMPLPEKKGNKKILIFAAVGVIAVAAVASAAIFLYFTFFNAKEIDIYSMLNIGYEGYNENASLVITLNNDNEIAIKKADLEKKLSDVCESVSSEECNKMSEEYNILTSAYDSISFDFEKNNALKNGDIVNVKCVVDEDLFKKAGYKVTGLEFNIEILGLQEVQVVDLFEGVSAKWEKIGGVYTPVVLNETEIMKEVGYDFYVPIGKSYLYIYLNCDEETLLNEYGIVSASGLLECETPIDSRPVDKKNDAIGYVVAKADLINVRNGYGVDASKSGKKVNTGEKKDVYEIQYKDGYTWYRINDTQWIADKNGDWLRYSQY